MPPGLSGSQVLLEREGVHPLPTEPGGEEPPGVKR